MDRDQSRENSLTWVFEVAAVDIESGIEIRKPLGIDEGFEDATDFVAGGL